jgi:hypothetical protein
MRKLKRLPTVTIQNDRVHLAKQDEPGIDLISRR